MRIVVLTGAGISAESGVPTFRDANGLWEGHRVEDVATPEGFEADPDLVLRFYDERRRAAASVVPNAAHRALARLEGAIGDELLVVTQNVDDLHERAGSRNLVHMHGELRRALCIACGARPEWTGDLIDRPPCPACGERMLRPDVVWFGELPYDLDRIEQAVVACDVFVSIGTSGSRVPGCRLRGARRGVRGADRRAQPRAERGDRAVRRGARGSRERGRARVGRRGHRRAMTGKGHAPWSRHTPHLCR